MSTAKFPVILAVQGQPFKTVNVGSGATIKSVLLAAKLDALALAGSVTMDGDQAELGDRVKRDAYIAVTPKVAGGIL